MLPAQPNQSLIDGLAVLQALAGSRAPVRGAELSRALGLEMTRVNRLLKTLAHLGLAAQDPDRRYRSGPGLHVLAAMSLYGSGLMRRALPHLTAWDRPWTLALGVLWRDRVAYLWFAAPGAGAERAMGQVGLYPATRSSIGLCLLARLEPAALEEHLAGSDLEGMADRADLDRRLAQIRADGFAVVHDSSHGPSVGLALTDGSAALACTGAIGPTDEKQAIEALTRISQRIG